MQSRHKRSSSLTIQRSPRVTYNGVLQGLTFVVLLFELLDLLQGKEGPASSPSRLLGVSRRPLLKCLWVATLHVQAQVLPVLGHKVAHVA